MEYGEVSLAGNFPSKEELGSDKKYNLDLLFCPICSLVQTNSIIESDKLFRDYRYMSSIGLSQHFSNVAKMLKEKFNPKKVLEIGANDGVLLKPLNDLGIETMGFDPAINVVKAGIEKGCNIIPDYFNEESVSKYKIGNYFDIVVANNCFAHIDDIHSIVKGVKKALKPDGYFIVEVHYIRDLVEQNQYETIYHEHLYYYSVTALNNLFKQYDMTIVNAEEIPIHGGSIRVYVKNIKEDINEEMKSIYIVEKNKGLKSFNYFNDFGNRVREHIEKVKNILKDIKKEGKTIIGYGASGRGNIFCNLCNITPDIIDYIVDESPERIDRYTAGTHIPIVSPQHIADNKPDYIFIFAWNYSKMIIDKLKGNNYKYIIAFPEINILDDTKLLNNKLFI
jgi:2-polyprenyl-3-methyl-5-hydroxy-6-metoxy-1,4-benzoquinol methylase